MKIDMNRTLRQIPIILSEIQEMYRYHSVKTAGLITFVGLGQTGKIRLTQNFLYFKLFSSYCEHISQLKLQFGKSHRILKTWAVVSHYSVFFSWFVVWPSQLWWAYVYRVLCLSWATSQFAAGSYLHMKNIETENDMNQPPRGHCDVGKKHPVKFYSNTFEKSCYN